MTAKVGRKTTTVAQNCLISHILHNNLLFCSTKQRIVYNFSFRLFLEDLPLYGLSVHPSKHNISNQKENRMTEDNRDGRRGGARGGTHMNYTIISLSGMLFLLSTSCCNTPKHTQIQITSNVMVITLEGNQT